jgi:3-methyladenine DNA glycosylase AlkC
MDSTEEMITIPKAEYEALKEKLKKRMFSNPDRINAYNKAHPEKHRAAVQRWKDAHREEYNARRRELRRLKKEAAAAAAANSLTTAGVSPNTAAFAPPS